MNAKEYQQVYTYILRNIQPHSVVHSRRGNLQCSSELRCHNIPSSCSLSNHREGIHIRGTCNPRFCWYHTPRLVLRLRTLVCMCHHNIPESQGRTGIRRTHPHIYNTWQCRIYCHRPRMSSLYSFYTRRCNLNRCSNPKYTSSCNLHSYDSPDNLPNSHHILCTSRLRSIYKPDNLPNSHHIVPRRRLHIYNMHPAGFPHIAPSPAQPI